MPGKKGRQINLEGVEQSSLMLSGYIADALSRLV